MNFIIQADIIGFCYINKVALITLVKVKELQLCMVINSWVMPSKLIHVTFKQLASIMYCSAFAHPDNIGYCAQVNYLVNIKSRRSVGNSSFKSDSIAVIVQYNIKYWT